MLVPDFMHEFELGIWKALFTHLVHILVSHGDGTVQEFNRRYRQVPTFGRSTIRRFSEDASGMKKLAARNFEDLLQVCMQLLEIWISFNSVQKCALPVFDGLLPDEHNNDILSLLFTTAEWHTLAKLRLHTDFTLAWLDESTKAFGKQIRRFESHTCSFFDTRELPHEEAARSRRQRKKKEETINLPNPSPLVPAPSTATPGRTKKKVFNLILIKLHALGDYVKTIKTFGTTDSYSTQPVWMLLLYLLLVLI